MKARLVRVKPTALPKSDTGVPVARMVAAGTCTCTGLVSEHIPLCNEGIMCLTTRTGRRLPSEGRHSVPGLLDSGLPPGLA
jgi:hypothetical protein